MSIDLLHLRKLLQLLYASDKQLPSLLRAEIRSDISKREGVVAGGGDFYGPFWSDVKDHIFGRRDLHDSTADRIEKNKGRERLYPILRDGFLRWWTIQRRWTNAPFEPVRAPAGVVKINSILSVRIDNMIAVQDSLGICRYIYPYFSESPSLKNEAGRIGLRVLQRGFPSINLANFRLLDVPRGRVFAPDRSFLEGDEDTILQRRFYEVWNKYISLEEEY